MDAAAAKALIQLGTYGPLGVMVVLFFILYWFQKEETQKERDRNTALQEKLHELSIISIKADMEHSKAYEPMEKVMDAAIKALAEKGKS